MTKNRNVKNRVVFINNYFIYQIPFDLYIDGDGTINYTVTQKPDWVSYDPSTRLLTGYPETADIGDTEIVIEVSDDSDTEEERFWVSVPEDVILEEIQNGDGGFTIREKFNKVITKFNNLFDGGHANRF